MISRKKVIILIAVVGLTGAAMQAWIEIDKLYRHHVYQVKVQQARTEAWNQTVESIRAKINEFRGETGIIVKDLSSGLEFRHNPEKAVAAASLSKVPLMGAVFLAAQNGDLDLSRRIQLKASDKMTGSGNLKEAVPGGHYTVEQLLGFMISDSDNTATNMLTNLFGLDSLNASFGQFGLTETRLNRRIADYEMRDKGYENYTTAAETALLFEQIYTGRFVSTDYSRKGMEILKISHTNDRIPKLLPEGTVVAHKTGLENGICHDAGIIFTPEGDLLLVVLTKHENANSIPSKEFIAKIALEAYGYFEISNRILQDKLS